MVPHFFGQLFSDWGLIWIDLPWDLRHKHEMFVVEICKLQPYGTPVVQAAPVWDHRGGQRNSCLLEVLYNTLYL